MQQLGLSLSKLVIEQEQDSEILNFKRVAQNERKAIRVPVCCFVNNNNNVLVKKWQPPNVPTSHEWTVVYQNCGPTMRYFSVSL